MEFIPLARPDINQDDIAALVAVLNSGMLVQGKKVDEFEKKLSLFLNTPNISAVSNGTATMHLALKVLGIGPGDEVIVPAFSYVATANVVELVGARPIFVDINIDTFNIDISAIEKAITKKTKAIIPVHEFGLACDIEQIIKLAKLHSIWVIEDAACALGAELNGKKVGTYGDFGSFSLHPRKAISSGEGGILVSKSEIHDRIVKSLRNHGIEMIDAKMEFTYAGFNYRMTDFQAALVNNQLDRLDKIISYKSELANTYKSLIKNEKIKLPTEPKGYKHTWQTFHVLLDSDLKRDEIIESLKLKNIGTNYGAQCIPAQHYYYQKYQLSSDKLFPNSTKAYQQGLALPLYERLSLEDIAYISEQINTIK